MKRAIAKLDAATCLPAVAQAKAGRSLGVAIEWPTLSLREANVTLIDCDHRTPPASEAGYPDANRPRQTTAVQDFQPPPF